MSCDYGVDDLVRSRVLDEVAAGACSQDLERTPLCGEGRERYDAAPRVPLQDPLRGLDAADRLHLDVHEYDIGHGSFALFDGFTPVSRLANESDSVVVRDERAQSVSHQGLVIDDENTHSFPHLRTVSRCSRVDL